MLIYDALKNDLIKVKQLLDELVSLREKATVRRTELISQIRDEGLLKTTYEMVVNMVPPKIAASLRTYNVSPRI